MSHDDEVSTFEEGFLSCFFFYVFEKSTPNKKEDMVHSLLKFLNIPSFLKQVVSSSFPSDVEDSLESC